ncbi:MAG: NACHT domain-containing protein, partial [Candidatus Heimdallarchaeota archaeon]
MQKRLKGWKKRMQQAGVNSVYAFVSASAIWPVVEAARAGDWGALTALGGVLTGMGGSLIANRIQSWKNEADAAKQLEKEALEDSNLRAELDIVLDKLNVLSLAEQTLAKSEQQWFVATLRDELNRMGNLENFEAVLKGSGAIAQGKEASALGQEAQYIKGQVQGDVLGPRATKIVYSSKQEEERIQREKARRRYLERLRRHCQALPLAALGGEEGSEEDLTLDLVYIDLDTTTHVEVKRKSKKASIKRTEFALEHERDTRLVSALEAAIQSPRMALLGDPGAGKSTFVRKLLAWIAAANLGEANPPSGFSADLLPILIVLRDLAPRLSNLNLKRLPEDRQCEILAASVRDQILNDLNRFEAAAFVDGMHEALIEGNCLLVLDGLDEVPFNLRNLVRQATAAVCRYYKLQRVIVTCRVRSYVGEAVLPNFKTYTLAPFDEKKVHEFAEAWYNALKNLGFVDSDQARQKSQNLIQAALSEGLRELSKNPMMLTTMAIIHQREIGLPKERVRLFNLVVDVLLRRWQKRKTGESDLVSSRDLAELFKDDLRLRNIMERLAYEAHKTGKGGREVVDIDRGTALTLLEKDEYLGSPTLASEFLDYVDQRAGLLVGRGGEPNRPASYSFPHRTFQEYLAGCYLVSQRDPARQYFVLAGEGEYWSLAAQLGAEEVLYNRRSLNSLL